MYFLNQRGKKNLSKFQFLTRSDHTNTAANDTAIQIWHKDMAVSLTGHYFIQCCFNGNAVLKHLLPSGMPAVLPQPMQPQGTISLLPFTVFASPAASDHCNQSRLNKKSIAVSPLSLFLTVCDTIFFRQIPSNSCILCFKPPEFRGGLRGGGRERQRPAGLCTAPISMVTGHAATAQAVGCWGRKWGPARPPQFF